MHHKLWYSMINIPTTMIVKITSTHLPYTLYFDMAHILCGFIFSPLWDLPMVKEKGSGSFSEVFILMSMVFWPSTFRASLSTVHFLPARVTPLANRVLRSLAMIALTSDAWRRHTQDWEWYHAPSNTGWDKQKHPRSDSPHVLSCFWRWRLSAAQHRP